MAPEQPRAVTRAPEYRAPIVDLSALSFERALEEDLRLIRETDPLEVYFVKYPADYPPERRI